MNLPPREAIDEWRAFPFRSIVGYFREPGRRLHWQDGAGNEAWGATLIIALGARRTRIRVKLDYYRRRAVSPQRRSTPTSRPT